MSGKHRGKILGEVAKRHLLSITEIANKAGYTQSTFYKHKALATLNFDILYKYARVMDYYFKSELPEFSRYLEDNNLDLIENRQFSYEELLTLIEKLRAKEVEDRETIIAHLNELKDCYKELKEKQVEIDELKREIAGFRK